MFFVASRIPAPGARRDPLLVLESRRPPEERCAIYELFRQVGRDCFVSGLVSSHAGNISVRLDDRLLITRRGAMLGALEQEDLVLTSLFEDDEESARASCELPTHRAIYRGSDAAAVLHTHPPHGIVLSLTADAIEPLDVEGALQLGVTPVVEVADPVGSEEMAEAIGGVLTGVGLCMLRGHGLFAAGSDLEDAFRRTTAFESSARIGYLAWAAGLRTSAPYAEP